MKWLFLLTFIVTGNAIAKTCTATMNAKLKYAEFDFPFTKVQYPDPKESISDALWKGKVSAWRYITPAPVLIECGSPKFSAKFERFLATGMLPEGIETGRLKCVGL